MENEEYTPNQVINGRDIALTPRIIETPAEVGQPLGFLTKEYVEQLQEQVELLKRVKLTVLRITDDEDWKDFDGKPYLVDSGIMKVAGVVNLEFGVPEINMIEGEDKLGKWVRYTTKLSARWRGRTLYDIGTSSTRDAFFAKARGTRIPFEEIDITSVEKKSITNAQHRLLVKTLGLGGLSWEQLQKLAGIHPPREKVRFRGTEQKAATGAGAWTQEKEKLWGLILQLVWGDEVEAGDRLCAYTENPERGFKGLRDVRQLTERQVSWLLPRVEKEYEQVMGERAGEGGADEPGARG